MIPRSNEDGSWLKDCVHALFLNLSQLGMGATAVDNLWRIGLSRLDRVLQVLISLCLKPSK